MGNHVEAQLENARLPGANVLTLRIYVTRGASNSVQALANLHAILDEHFSNRCTLEVVDILQDPQRALADGILVTPTLARLAPAPVIRIIGNLSQTEKVLQALRT
jgi:circadian clock protein KaiB